MKIFLVVWTKLVDLIKKLPSSLWLVVAALIVYILVRKRALSASEKRFDEIFSTPADYDRNNPASVRGYKEKQSALVASQFYSAFFPSGREWVSDSVGDGTDEELIFRQIVNMKVNALTLTMVGQLYNMKYHRNLLLDLQKELSGEEYERFMGMV